MLSKNILFVIAGPLLLTACMKGISADAGSEASASLVPTAEQIERRQRSESVLRELGVPVNEELGFMPAASATQLRDEAEVEQRAMCLLVLGTKAEQMPPQVVSAMIRRYRLEGAFTPDEQAFLDAAEPSADQVLIARWRYESARTLLWALDIIDELAPPTQVTDVPAMVRIMTGMSAESYSEQATLRSKDVILDAVDLAYRLHAVTHVARERGRAAPGGVVESVVYEREYALKWLIGYRGLPWDELMIEPES
jgi:hypothetical protein